MGISKTNQEGVGRPENDKPIQGPAAVALADWLKESGVIEGPIFRRIRKGERVAKGLSPSAVRDIVKKRCALAGLAAVFSAHSLRRGFVTEASVQGASIAGGRWAHRLQQVHSRPRCALGTGA